MVQLPGRKGKEGCWPKLCCLEDVSAVPSLRVLMRTSHLPRWNETKRTVVWRNSRSAWKFRWPKTSSPTLKDVSPCHLTTLSENVLVLGLKTLSSQNAQAARKQLLVYRRLQLETHQALQRAPHQGSQKKVATSWCADQDPSAVGHILTVREMWVEAVTKDARANCAGLLLLRLLLWCSKAMCPPGTDSSAARLPDKRRPSSCLQLAQEDSGKARVLRATKRASSGSHWTWAAGLWH